MRNILLLLALALLVAQPAEASETFRHTRYQQIQATGRISATIVAPVSMRAVKDMSFGMMVNNKTGQATMDETGNIAANNLTSANSTTSAGSVLVKGPQGHLVTVSIPESNIYDNENNALEFKPSISEKYRNFALSPQNGEGRLNIGGTLKFNHNNISNGTKKGFYVVQTSY